MIQNLKIPKRRVAVLIGKKGETRKNIEDSAKVRLKVSKEGDVVVEGEPEGVLTSVEIVKSIARGFRPEKALLLLNESNRLVTISLQGETQRTVKRLLSRVIGKEGMSKRNIERLTGAFLCIRGKTISVLGESQAVENAALAVEDLLGGRTHSFVYSRLEKMKRVAERE